MPDHFTYHGHRIPYSTAADRLSDRALELGLVEWWLEGRDGRGVVIDEPRDVDGSYDWIVASGAGWVPDEGVEAAVTYLVQHLASSGQMLITLPLGVDAKVDEAAATGLGTWRDCVMIRSLNPAAWVQKPRGTWRPYGLSTSSAEAVWVGEIFRPPVLPSPRHRLTCSASPGSPSGLSTAAATGCDEGRLRSD